MSFIHTISFLCWVPSENMRKLVAMKISTAGLTSWLANLVLWTLYLHPNNDRLHQIIKTPEDLHTGPWSLSFQSSIRREGDPIRTMMLANIPEWSRQSFSSYAETDRSRLSCTTICYHKQKGRDLLQNRVDSLLRLSGKESGLSCTVSLQVY